MYCIIIGAMAIKKKAQKIRQDKLSTAVIKPEPIEVIEIFDDWSMLVTIISYTCK